MEDVDGLTEKDLGMIRQLMPMGADYEGEEDPGDEKEEEVGDEEGDKGDVKREVFDEDVGDGFPESADKDFDEEAAEEYAHTEL